MAKCGSLTSAGKRKERAGRREGRQEEGEGREERGQRGERAGGGRLGRLMRRDNRR